MAKAVFTPALAPEGTVTVTLSESEARAFAAGYAPRTSYALAKPGEAAYAAARDNIRYVIRYALAPPIGRYIEV